MKSRRVASASSSRRVGFGLQHFKRPPLADFAANLHERIYQEQLSKAVHSLGKNHPIKILLAEHENIIQSLYLLNKANAGLQASRRFENVTVDLWERLNESVLNFKLADKHFYKEEKYLFPGLVERGLYANVKMILEDHKEVHELIKRLVLAFEEGLEDRFEETASAINAIVIALSEKTRKLIFKENYVLYPAAIRLISGDRPWKGIISEWKKVGNFQYRETNRIHSAA